MSDNEQSRENENQVIAAAEVLPNRIYVVPLQGKPIFPGIFTPIMITGTEDIAVIDKAMETNKVVGLVLTTDPNADSPSHDQLHKAGTAAKIVKRINLPDGGINIFISTLKRFRIRRIHNEVSPYHAVVDYLEDDYNPEDKELKALTRALITEMKEISEDNPLFTEEMRLNMVNIDNPGKIADFITSILNVDREKQQEILGNPGCGRSAWGMVLIYIKKEHELARIQKRIAGEINEKIEKSQRDYFLREELKAIKKELGGTRRCNVQASFKSSARRLMPSNSRVRLPNRWSGEMEKFQVMEPSSSEYIVTRSYLDWIISLPWPEPPADEIDMPEARRVLDEDHFGLEDVKERILEYLAVRKLKEDSKGSIVLLVGPPGVGKTSIGKSIARSMKRPFFRFSVGGMRDEAEIKGHRRTYVGAMPGEDSPGNEDCQIQGAGVHD